MSDLPLRVLFFRQKPLKIFFAKIFDTSRDSIDAGSEEMSVVERYLEVDFDVTGLWRAVADLQQPPHDRPLAAGR